MPKFRTDMEVIDKDGEVFLSRHGVKIGVMKAYLVRLVGIEQRFFVPFATSGHDAYQQALVLSGWRPAKAGEQPPLVERIVEAKVPHQSVSFAMQLREMRVR